VPVESEISEPVDDMATEPVEKTTEEPVEETANEPEEGVNEPVEAGASESVCARQGGHVVTGCKAQYDCSELQPRATSMRTHSNEIRLLGVIIPLDCF
jgi:hypothetical protein